MTASCNFYNQIGSKYTSWHYSSDITQLRPDTIHTAAQRVNNLPSPSGKGRKKTRYTKTSMKNMHVLWVKTHLAVEWKHMMFSFVLGSAFYTPDDLVYLNKTSPFPGSVVLCLKSVNIYKPYEDCDKSECVPVSLFQLPSLFLAVKGLFIFPEISNYFNGIWKHATITLFIFYFKHMAKRDYLSSLVNIVHIILPYISVCGIHGMRHSINHTVQFKIK